MICSNLFLPDPYATSKYTNVSNVSICTYNKYTADTPPPTLSSPKSSFLGEKSLRFLSSKKKELPFNDCHVFDSFQFVGPIMSRGAPTHGRSRGPAQARERDRAGLSGLLEVLVSAHPCVCARACRSSSPCCSPPSLLYRRGSFWTLQRLDRAPPDAASRAAASRAACRVNPKQVVYRGSPVCVCKRACVREKEREKERERDRE